MSKVLTPIRINVRSDPDLGICFPIYFGASEREANVYSEAQVRALLAEARKALRFVKEFRQVQPIVERAMLPNQARDGED